MAHFIYTCLFIIDISPDRLLAQVCSVMSMKSWATWAKWSWLSRSLIHIFFPYPLTQTLLQTETRTYSAFRQAHQHASCPALLFISLRSVNFHLSLSSITTAQRRGAGENPEYWLKFTHLFVDPSLLLWSVIWASMSNVAPSCLSFNFQSGLSCDEHLSFCNGVLLLDLLLSCSDLTPLINNVMAVLRCVLWSKLLKDTHLLTGWVDLWCNVALDLTSDLSIIHSAIQYCLIWVCI